VAGVTVGLNLVTSTAWPPSSSPEAWATAPPQEQAAALRLLLAEGDHQLRLGALVNILLPA
jgi:hypothetical protein